MDDMNAIEKWEEMGLVESFGFTYTIKQGFSDKGKMVVG